MEPLSKTETKPVAPALERPSILGSRYDADGRTILALSSEQRAIVQRISEKVRSGEYRFETAPCAVCDTEEFEVLATKDRYGLYLPVVICRDCGLIQSNPRMSRDAYDEFYESEFAPLYRGSATAVDAHFRFRHGHGRRIVEYLRRNGVLNREPAETLVVDIGCSHGGVLRAFQEAGYQVKGLDLNGDYLAYGRDKFGMNLVKGDLESVQLERAPDLVVYCQVFEHITDPVAELARVRAVSNGATRLYIEVPGVRNLFPRYHMDFLRLLQNAHVYHFTLDSLTNLLGRNGFARVVGDEEINSVFRFDESACARKVVNDYQSVVGWLRRAEILRRVYPGPLISRVGRLTRRLRTGLGGGRS